MTCLYNILKFYIYPRTLKIVSGTLTSEEGKQFGPGDQIVVYGGGIKVYVTPGDISLLQSGKGRELFETDSQYGNFDVGGRIINSLFVPHNVGFKDTHYSRKTYTRVSELLLDRPRYVKANTNFLMLQENDDMRKINEGDLLELLYESKDVTSLGKGGKTIKAKVDDEIIMIHDSNKQLNVDSVLDEQEYDCNFVLNDRFTLPRIMSFSNKEIHQMFGLRTGYSRFVINKYKYAMCLSECLDKQSDHLGGNMSVVRGVNCIDEDIKALKKVRVEVLKNSAKDKLTASFAHDTGMDPDGFKLYDVYLQVKQHTDGAAMRPPAPLPVPTSSPEDSDSSDLGYEEPVPGAKRQDESEEETPPVPPRVGSSRRSEEMYGNCNQTDERSNQASKTKSERKPAVLPRQRSHPGHLINAMTADDTNRVSTHCGDLGPVFGKGDTPDEDDELFCDDESDDKVNDDKPIHKPCGTVRPMHMTSSLPTGMSLTPATSSANNHVDRSPRRTVSDSQVRESKPVQQEQEDKAKQHFTLSEMSVSELKEFLISQKFQKLGLICEEQNIDGEFLVTMTDEDLKIEPFCLTLFEIKKYKRLRDGNLPKL